jgi:hypothetical protein
MKEHLVALKHKAMEIAPGIMPKKLPCKIIAMLNLPQKKAP